MSRVSKDRQKPPTLASLRKVRGELNGVVRSLHDARAKTRDVAERARIDGALREVGTRVERLSRTIATVMNLKARQKAYDERIANLGQRIDKVTGRSYRGNYRWLRHWRNL